MTKAKAEAVKRSVMKAFPVYAEYEPLLVENYMDTGHWAVVWEEGPYEWVHTYITRASGYTAVNEEFGWKDGPVKPVPGVFVDAYYSYSLSVYPD